MRYKLVVSIAALVALVLPAWAQAKRMSPDLSPEARASYENVRKAIAERDLSTARREVERVVELAPDFPYGYNYYYYVLVQTDQNAMKAAAERYQKLAQASPDRSAYWYAFGRLTPDAAARVDAFNHVVALEPDAPYGYLGLGWAYRLSGQSDKAIPVYEKAHSIAPSDALISSGLIGAYATGGRRADALKLLDEVLKQSPGTYDADTSFINILTSTDSDAERATLADRYIAAFPSGQVLDQAYYYSLAAQALKDKPAAAARAREALAKLTAPRFLDSRAILYREFILIPAQERGLESLDKLADELAGSKEPSPGIYLAVGQAELGNKSPKALPLLTRANDLNKALPHPSEELGDEIHGALGMAYAAAGDTAHAIENYEAVRPEAEGYLEAQSGLADVYKKTGNTAKAYETLVHVVAREPNTERSTALAEVAKAAGHSPEDVDAAVWAARDATAKAAPDFTLNNLEGKTVSLSSYRGKIVLLSFWFPG